MTAQLRDIDVVTVMIRHAHEIFAIPEWLEDEARAAYHLIRSDDEAAAALPPAEVRATAIIANVQPR